jgi:hypothetical protein
MRKKKRAALPALVLPRLRVMCGRDAAAAANGVLGSNGRMIASVVLSTSEVGAPNNAIFNRGFPPSRLKTRRSLWTP